MINKSKIDALLSEQIPYLKDKYNVKKLGYFGSVARGDAHEGSDIDMLVEFKTPIGFFDFIRMENYLSDILGVKVDLVTKNALKEAIRKNVLGDVVYV